MTAEHVLLLSFLGMPLDAIRAGAVQHIMSTQRGDGSWAQFYGGPADLSTTIEAYAALKVLGVNGAGDAMTRALRTVHNLGGVARARVFTKIWLALFGQYPWAGVPSMPPELVHFPLWAPFNLYDFACWARGTIAPLLIVISRRPVRPPRQPGRARARRKLVSWVVERQEADGGWGGIQPPWVYSLIALHLEGMGLDHPVMRKGIQGLDGFALEDEGGWRFQACMSPVWDTAWVVLALRQAGVPRDDPRLEKAIRWLLAEQITTGGDWQVRSPGAECGGWAFEFENDCYPDIDDAAVVVLALLAAAPPGLADDAVRRAVDWVLAMRSSNGAWA